jgi:hypothetical protein
MQLDTPLGETCSVSTRSSLLNDTAELWLQLLQLEKDYFIGRRLLLAQSWVSPESCNEYRPWYHDARTRGLTCLKLAVFPSLILLAYYHKDIVALPTTLRTLLRWMRRTCCCPRPPRRQAVVRIDEAEMEGLMVAES